MPTSARAGHEPPRAHLRIAARSILIASGGAGQVYSDTTNPAVATGDGIALAAAAGAELADMEFYQFHPTALALPRRAALPRLRGAARRGRIPAQRSRRALHGALPSPARTRPARRGGPRHRPRRHARPCAHRPDKAHRRAAPRLSRHAPRAQHRSRRALSRHQRISRALRPRPPPRPHPHPPRRALPHGRHPHRSRRPHHPRRALRCRRSRLHRRARRQSPCLEFPARRPCLRRACRALHAFRLAPAGERRISRLRATPPSTCPRKRPSA